ncbi:hypothetical protein HJC23_004391 [Cyclotella cryptica]|uniref:Uncharacterized protein n=1 Tax=Cyclotella cryptica TaxID=29204 RepID=A0ABD3PJ80_9STRA
MTTPSKQSASPLYPHVIQRLEDNRIIASSSAAMMSPASFLIKDETVSAGNAVVTKFWVEAHALSCFKRVSFWSSLETTFDDTMSSLLKENEDDCREMARENVREIILAKVEDECAMIDPDGNILNDSGDKTSFTLAVCIVDHHTTCTHWTTQQAQAVATLSGLQLSSNTTNLRRASMDTEEQTATTTTTKQAQTSSSWVQYVTLPVRTISHGISYAIDSILGDEYTMRLNAEGVSSHHPSFREELDDRSSSSKTTINVSNQIDKDDAALIAKGVAGATLNHRPWDITDNIISFGAIVSSCRYFLSYTNQIVSQNSHARDEFFFLCDTHGNTDRIILHKYGFGHGSIGSMCRHCGNHFTADATSMGIDESNTLLQHYVGNLLSNVSEDGVNLLAETLVKAQYAFMDEETITLFPNGTPPQLYQMQIRSCTLSNSQYKNFDTTSNATTRTGRGNRETKCRHCAQKRNDAVRSRTHETTKGGNGRIGTMCLPPLQPGCERAPVTTSQG